MTDDTAIRELREELDRQREAADARHQALVDELARQRSPLTAAEARATMARGYEQSAKEREGEQAGGES